MWKFGSFPCPQGTQKVIFLCENTRTNQGACAVDNIQVVENRETITLSGDATHLTAPSEDGTGAILAMDRAVKDAGIETVEITFINAHATSTPLGDGIELKAIESFMGQHSKNVTVSSTKGAHGHLLGAAGNLEAVFTILAIKESVIPPTLNLHNLDTETSLNFAPNIKKNWNTTSRRVALKNAFGFGGTNACLCFAQYNE